MELVAYFSIIAWSMGIRQEHIKQFLLKAGLLVVTAVFFLVQILFNNEIANQTSYKKLLSIDSKQGQNEFKVHHLQDQPSKKTQKGVRLNKRFFPESIPAIEAVIVRAPERHCIVEFNSTYTSNAVPAPLFLIQELRGPPVVA